MNVCMAGCFHTISFSGATVNNDYSYANSRYTADMFGMWCLESFAVFGFVVRAPGFVTRTSGSAKPSVVD